MDGTLGAAVEIGVTIGCTLAVVGIGQFYARMWASRKLAENPQNVTAQSLLLIF